MNIQPQYIKLYLKYNIIYMAKINCTVSIM